MLYYIATGLLVLALISALRAKGLQADAFGLAGSLVTLADGIASRSAGEISLGASFAALWICFLVLELRRRRAA